MKNAKAVICALARDCASAIERNIPNVEKLRKQFAECDVLVIENDSKDNTKQVLSDWAKKSVGIYVVSNDFGTLTIPSKTENSVLPAFSYHRIEKMARYRNMYLEWVEMQNKNYDYVIVLDIDAHWFNPKNIAKIISKAPDDWGALCANGRGFCGLRRGYYYDIYAFSEKEIGEKYTLVQRGYEYWMETLRIRKLVAKNAYTSVHSAFGGLSIYKYSAITGSRYQAVFNADEKIEVWCEHVSLNEAILKKGYKIYIARELDLIIASAFNFLFEIKVSLFQNQQIRSFLLKHHLAKEFK